MENRQPIVKIITGHVDQRQEITRAEGDIIIAVDSGIRVARERGIIPDYLVGDLDSALSEDVQWAADQGVTIQQYPSEKDEVDTELALSLACQHTPCTISIYNELDERFDHAVALLYLLLQPLHRSIPCNIVGYQNTVYLVNQTLRLAASLSYVSIFPFSQEASVRATGLKYTLPETLYIHKPLGISNEFVKDEAEITVKQGIILVIVSKMV